MKNSSNKWKLIKKGEPASCNYDNFDEGLISVKMHNKYGLINNRGKEIMECKYEKIAYFNKDLAKVELDNKWGLINTNGELVSEIKYDAISRLI